MEKPIRGLIWYPGKIQYHIEARVLLTFIISDSWACLSIKNCLSLTVTQPTMWISPFHINLNLWKGKGNYSNLSMPLFECLQMSRGRGEKEMSSFWSCLLIFLKCLFLDVYSWFWQIFRVRNRELQLQKSSNVFGVKWSREKTCLVKSNSPEATDSRF